jgi:hypothetical protein
MQRTAQAAIALVERQGVHTLDIETFNLADAAPPQNRSILLRSLPPLACRFQFNPIKQIAE